MRDRLPVVFAAPHRLAFLVGSLNLALLAAWWLLRLVALGLGVAILPEGDLPPALLHGPAMLYLIYPPFVFGFLLTVFPRWMGFPDLQPRAFGPVSLALAAGSALVQAGLWTGIDAVLVPGFVVLALGWAMGLSQLGRVLATNRREARPVCWHGWSALAALTCGLAGLLFEIAFLLSLDPRAWQEGIRLALSGFIVPVFLTVAHRMVPFFAGNVVKGYAAWRPLWLLGAMWVLLAGRAVSPHLGHDGLAIAANIGLAALTALMLHKWWPRADAPGLLMVLFWGLSWAPLGFAMAAAPALGIPLGRAPDHALLIGFAGSLVIAMVTRVTHGHSGRPLAMSGPAWLAFAAIQASALARIGAALADESRPLLVIAAMVFALGLLPWVLRHVSIYVLPRLDGKVG